MCRATGRHHLILNPCGVSQLRLNRHLIDTDTRGCWHTNTDHCEREGKKGKKGAICHEPNGKSKTTSTPRVASRCNGTPQVCRAPGGYISAGRCLSETVPLRWLLPASYILCIHITLRSTWAQDPAGSGRTDQSGKLPALFELVTCEFQGFPTGVMHADINLRCASKGEFHLCVELIRKVEMMSHAWRHDNHIGSSLGLLEKLTHWFTRHEQRVQNSGGGELIEMRFEMRWKKQIRDATRCRYDLRCDVMTLTVLLLARV